MTVYRFMLLEHSSFVSLVYTLSMVGFSMHAAGASSSLRPAELLYSSAGT